jgi:hypothetical protein
MVEAVTETPSRITESGGGGVVILGTAVPEAIIPQIGENLEVLYSPLCCSSLATSAVQPV